MARKGSIEDKITQYFETTELGTAKAVLSIATGILKRRNTTAATTAPTEKIVRKVTRRRTATRAVDTTIPATPLTNAVGQA